jgi:hypothetical protein
MCSVVWGETVGVVRSKSVREGQAAMSERRLTVSKLWCPEWVSSVKSGVTVRNFMYAAGSTMYCSM